MNPRTRKVSTPQRIQRKRTKGWKMPPNTVYVGRPTVWGNPFGTAEEYRAALEGLSNYRSVLQRWFRAHGWVGSVPIGHEISSWLRGKNLACWCALDQPCHADVLLEIANGEL